MPGEGHVPRARRGGKLQQQQPAGTRYSVPGFIPRPGGGSWLPLPLGHWGNWGVNQLRGAGTVNPAWLWKN